MNNACELSFPSPSLYSSGLCLCLSLLSLFPRAKQKRMKLTIDFFCCPGPGGSGGTPGLSEDSLDGDALRG